MNTFYVLMNWIPEPLHSTSWKNGKILQTCVYTFHRHIKRHFFYNTLEHWLEYRNSCHFYYTTFFSFTGVPWIYYILLHLFEEVIFPSDKESHREYSIPLTHAAIINSKPQKVLWMWVGILLTQKQILCNTCYMLVLCHCFSIM